MSAELLQVPPCPNYKHDWQPISFALETRIYDGPSARIVHQQPALENGRVWCVCMKCFHHTYIETRWVGYFVTPPPPEVSK